MMDIDFNERETHAFSEQLRKNLRNGITPSKAKILVRNLGSCVNNHSAQFLFWHPFIEKADRVIIEFFVPPRSLVFDKPEQHLNLTYYSFPAFTDGEFAFAVVNHLPSGNRDRFGTFYQLSVIDQAGNRRVIRDPMAYSLPYGIFAPAELYDIDTVLNNRKDAAYFHQMEEQFLSDEDHRIKASVNLLEIHTATTTKEGTLQALTKRFRQIGQALANDEELSPDEINLMGFDAIELMPLEPVVQHPQHHLFWKPIQQPKNNGDEITVHLKKPSVTNWGYDSLIFGAAAVNPSLLTTGRPHELLELIETLHNFPGQPVKIVLDIVYGHAHNQALELLPHLFFTGPNPYGQNLNYRHPMVRAIILEMQRRKINWGFDGIRVDGAQDFRYFDKVSGKMVHDDEFLNEMSEVDQHVAGVNYKPWVIFEDARPWPRDDWKLTSTYRDITLQQEHPHQWASMIFAYNTPYNYTYWISRWWRIREMLEAGEKWISGYANHDTMRRAAQADPSGVQVNTMLGNSLKSIMNNAFNNPSTTLLMNGFLPGVPMDFAHALGSTPWSFIRNADTTHAAKIIAEEAFFAEWQITDVEYRSSRFFKRLKDFGFQSLSELRRFTKSLLYFTKAAGDHPEVISQLLNCMEPPFAVSDWNPDTLHRFAGLWMADIHDYCNTDMHTDHIDPQKASFNLKVREFRLQNPWLANSFTEKDILTYRKPVDGAVIFYGYRKEPAGSKELVFLANMEGFSRQIIPEQLGLPIDTTDNWNIVLATPTIKPKSIHQPIRLAISQGMIFQKG